MGDVVRLVTKAGYQARDLVQHRIAVVRSGGSLDPFLETGRLRVVMASLVSTGLVEEGDWRLSGVPLLERGAHIDGMRSEVCTSILRRIEAIRTKPTPGNEEGVLAVADQAILKGFVVLVADLVVEMASVVLHHERMHAVLVEPSRRRPKMVERRFHDPVDLVARSLLHSDPVAFVADAKERIRVAREDLAKGRRRMVYLTAERKSEEAKNVPRPVSLDGPGLQSMVSAIRGAVDDLLRPVEPVKDISPDPRKRRR